MKGTLGLAWPPHWQWAALPRHLVPPMHGRGARADGMTDPPGLVHQQAGGVHDLPPLVQRTLEGVAAGTLAAGSAASPHSPDTHSCRGESLPVPLAPVPLPPGARTRCRSGTTALGVNVEPVALHTLPH